MGIFQRCGFRIQFSIPVFRNYTDTKIKVRILPSNLKWKEIYIQIIWVVKDNENESSEKFLIAGLRTMPAIKNVGWITEKIKFLKPIVFCWIDKSYKSNAKIVFLFRKWGLKFRKIWKLGQIVAKLCGSICKFSGFERLNVGFELISECN